MRLVCRPLVWLVAVSLSAGCATTVPYTGQGPHPQITRGQPIPPVDFIGNIFALPIKLILWNWKVDNHAVSAETEQYLVDYIDTPASRTEATHFSLNEYAPGRALSRLVRNRKVKWPYRLLLGLPVTLLIDVLLPGRLFGGLIGGDNYNPFTDTVSIYSDLPSVALHEAGHAHDSNGRRWKGTYALIRLIPFVDLYQEYKATDEAFDYLIATGEHEQEINAYKVLYPAYGTYVGGYFFIPGGSLLGAVLGHIIGRTKAHERRVFYESFDRATPATASPAPATP